MFCHEDNLHINHNYRHINNTCALLQMCGVHWHPMKQAYKDDGMGRDKD